MRLSTLKELLNQIDEVRFESSNGTILTDHIQITEVNESQKKLLIAEQRFNTKFKDNETR
tara:strand:- start:216 stop:395 length:180 start_codon:yes stop_codon:yes gene_type:complete